MNLGALEQVLPAPFPLLPLPKALINTLEGLYPWEVHVLREPNIMEARGIVWGETKTEAEEAAEAGIEDWGGIRAVGVVPMEMEW